MTQYTLYFQNLTTGVVASQRRFASSAYNARENFRKYLRKYDELRSGDQYRLVVADGSRSLDDFPDECFSAHYIQTAR